MVFHEMATQTTARHTYSPFKMQPHSLLPSIDPDNPKTCSIHIGQRPVRVFESRLALFWRVSNSLLDACPKIRSSHVWNELLSKVFASSPHRTIDCVFVYLIYNQCIVDTNDVQRSGLFTLNLLRFHVNCYPKDTHTFLSMLINPCCSWIQFY